MKREFFKNGLFAKPCMMSRIETNYMTVAERLLGYLIGPFGTAALIAVMGQLSELYYTEIFYVDQLFGVGAYLGMSWTVRVVGILMGLAAAYVVEHTVSTAGRIRPLVLIGSLITAVSSFFMFFIPEMPQGAQMAWVVVFNILYNSVGVTLFNLRSNLLTLCTRDQKERNQVNLLDKVSSYLLVGTTVTLVVGSILYYTMLHGYPASNWYFLVGAVALVSIPLAFVEYFYTKERITLEDSQVEGYVDVSSRTSLKKQISALFHSHYWVLAMVIGMVTTICSNISGYNLSTNFCTVILGAAAENNYSLIYTIVSGVPLGIGVLIIYPLSQKFTIRKTTMAFGVLAILGCVVGLAGGANFPVAVAANFLFNMGALPVVYILTALTNAANDEVEYKFGFRPEGTVAAALVGCVTGIICGAFSGCYETGLSMNGYLPEKGVNQVPGVVNWIYFVRYVVLIIEYVVLIILLKFMDLEKKLPKMQAEIQERHRRGQV